MKYTDRTIHIARIHTDADTDPRYERNASRRVQRIKRYGLLRGPYEMRWSEEIWRKKNNNKTKTNFRTNHTTRKSKREFVDVVVYLVAVSSIKLAWDLSILVFVCVSGCMSDALLSQQMLFLPQNKLCLSKNWPHDRYVSMWSIYRTVAYEAIESLRARLCLWSSLITSKHRSYTRMYICMCMIWYVAQTKRKNATWAKKKPRTNTFAEKKTSIAWYKQLRKQTTLTVD